MPEILDQKHRAAAERLVVNGNARDVKVENRGADVDQHDDRDGQFCDAADQRNIQRLQHRGDDFGADEDAADYRTEHDGGDGQPFHPAIRLDQLAGRQIFGEDAVFGGRIGSAAQADQAVGDQRMDADQNREAAEYGILTEYLP